MHTTTFIRIVVVYNEFHSEYSIVHRFLFEIRLRTTNLIGTLLQRVMRQQIEHWRQGELFAVVSTLSWLTNRASGCLVVESKISTLSVSGRPFQIVLFSSIFSWAIFLADFPCVASVGIPGFMISHVCWCPETAPPPGYRSAE